MSRRREVSMIEVKDFPLKSDPTCATKMRKFGRSVCTIRCCVLFVFLWSCVTFGLGLFYFAQPAPTNCCQETCESDVCVRDGPVQLAVELLERNFAPLPTLTLNDMQRYKNLVAGEQTQFVLQVCDSEHVYWLQPTERPLINVRNRQSVVNCLLNQAVQLMARNAAPGEEVGEGEDVFLPFHVAISTWDEFSPSDPWMSAWLLGVSSLRASHLVHVPDFAFLIGYGIHYTAFIEGMREKALVSWESWQKRIPQVAWRGKDDRPNYSPDTSSYRRSWVRSESKRNNIFFVGNAEAAAEYMFARHLTRLEMCEFKYLLYLDGINNFRYSASKRFLLACGSLLFVENHAQAQEWWTCALEPWTHYIPVCSAAEMYEIIEEIEAAPAGEFAQKAYRIAHAGQQFALTNITHERAIDYTAQLLSAYSTLYRSKLTAPAVAHLEAECQREIDRELHRTHEPADNPKPPLKFSELLDDRGRLFDKSTAARVALADMCPDILRIDAENTL